jgi:hypothetical protein
MKNRKKILLETILLENVFENIILNEVTIGDVLKRRKDLNKAQKTNIEYNVLFDALFNKKTRFLNRYLKNLVKTERISKEDAQDIIMFSARSPGFTIPEIMISDDPLPQEKMKSLLASIADKSKALSDWVGERKDASAEYGKDYIKKAAVSIEDKISKAKQQVDRMSQAIPDVSTREKFIMDAYKIIEDQTTAAKDQLDNKIVQLYQVAQENTDQE